MSEPVYKILSRTDWESFDASGHYGGSADDKRDGFIHLSAADQIKGTCERHFGTRRDLVLLAIDQDKLDGGLKWEEARDGKFFPHYYGELPAGSVIGAETIPDEGDARALMLALSST